MGLLIRGLPRQGTKFCTVPEIFEPSITPNALRVEILSTGEHITFINQFSSGFSSQFPDLAGLGEIAFADGTILDRQQIAAAAFTYGTDGNDTLITEGTAIGGLGNDRINAFGDGPTQTRSIWNEGDGNDTLSGVQMLDFADVNSGEVGLFLEENGTITVDIAPTGEAISLASSGEGPRDPFPGGPGLPPVLMFTATPDPVAEASAAQGLIEEIRFASGQVWDLHDITAALRLRSSDGDDVVTGTTMADRVDGADGNDLIDGAGAMIT